MFSSSEDGTLKIWDLRAPTCQRDYESRAGSYAVLFLVLRVLGMREIK